LTAQPAPFAHIRAQPPSCPADAQCTAVAAPS
jgi:hypothetical protein